MSSCHVRAFQRVPRCVATNLIFVTYTSTLITGRIRFSSGQLFGKDEVQIIWNYFLVQDTVYEFANKLKAVLYLNRLPQWRNVNFCQMVKCGTSPDCRNMSKTKSLVRRAPTSFCLLCTESVRNDNFQLHWTNQPTTMTRRQHCGFKCYQQKLKRCWSLWLLNFLQNSPISKIILWSGIYLQSITKMNRLGCCCKIGSLTFKYFASNFRICQEISTSNAKRNDMTEIMKIIRILFLFWKVFYFWQFKLCFTDILELICKIKGRKYKTEQAIRYSYGFNQHCQYPDGLLFQHSEQIYLVNWQILQFVKSSRAEFLNWGFNHLSTLQFLKRHSQNYWEVIF